MRKRPAVRRGGATTDREPTVPPIRAQPGPQEMSLASPADIVILGGSAGCGKTWALLLDPLYHIQHPGFSAVIFRRTYPELASVGGLWQESKRLYPRLGATPRETTLEWLFPSGARVKFAHMQHEDDRLAWKGAQVPLIEFDQVEMFTEDQFWYMLSRNRDPSGAVRPYIRASCNPMPEDDPIGGWLCRLIAWWLDDETGLPRADRAGTVRWFVRINDQLEWADAPETLLARYPDTPPKSLAFVPGTLEDNPALLAADPSYRASLLALPLIERERLLGGNWKVRAAAGKVYNRAWFPIVDAAPRDARRVRYWDKAGTAGGGAYSAGVRMAEAGGLYYVEDVIRGQWSSLERNTVIRETARLDGVEVAVWVEQEPGPIWAEDFVTLAEGRRVPLRDVKVGTRVINGVGVATTVVGAHDRGELQTVKFRLDSGRTVCAAPDHLMLTPVGWIAARDIIVGDVFALKSCSDIECISTPTLKECRLAGYFTGDGCVTWRSRRPMRPDNRPSDISESEWSRRQNISRRKRLVRKSCNATVVCSDPLQGKDIIACAESVGASVRVGDRRGWSYVMKGRAMQDWLHDRDLAGKGTDNKSVPEWIASAGNEAVAHFIGAFFVCDGCASIGRDGKVAVEMVNTNRQVLVDIQSLLLRFGIFSILKRRHYSDAAFQATRRQLYRLTLRSGDDSVAKFAERIPTFGRKSTVLALARRRSFDQNYLPDEVVEVVPGGVRRCICLTVSDGESFCVNDVIVHNSGGKESAEITVRELAGYEVRAEPVTGDKITRAGPLSAQAEAGNVKLVSGGWNREFLDEVHVFSEGKYKDQCDAAAGAFAKLALGRSAAIEIITLGEYVAPPKRVTMRW